MKGMLDDFTRVLRVFTTKEMENIYKRNIRNSLEHQTHNNPKPHKRNSLVMEDNAKTDVFPTYLSKEHHILQNNGVNRASMNSGIGIRATFSLEDDIMGGGGGWDLY